MWKKLMTTGLLITALSALPLDALADHRDRRDGWDRRDQGQHWDRRYSRRDWERRQHWRHSNRHYWRGHWYRVPPHYRYRRHGDLNRAYLGGALVGSAITWGLLHDQNDHRYCDTRRRRH